jgi:hypothetical protein
MLMLEKELIGLCFGCLEVRFLCQNSFN